MTTATFIDQLAAGDAAEAKSTLNDLLSKRAFEALDAKKVEIAKSATIRGENVYLEDGVRIMDNAVIIGPAYIGKNTIIATNAMVRGSHIGADCVIGFGTEVARSYVGEIGRAHV